MPRDHEYIIEQYRSWLRNVYRQHRDLSLLEEITTVGTDACTKVRSQLHDPPPVPERIVPAEVRAEIDDLSGQNIRLTRSLEEAKAELGTLKDRVSRLAESYKEAKTEIATLKKRLTTAQATAAEAIKQKLPSHQGPATPNNETSSETGTMYMSRRGGELPLLLRLGLGRRRLPQKLNKARGRCERCLSRARTTRPPARGTPPRFRSCGATPIRWTGYGCRHRHWGER